MNNPLANKVARNVAKQYVPDSEEATLLSQNQLTEIIIRGIQVYELERRMINE